MNAIRESVFEMGKLTPNSDQHRAITSVTTMAAPAIDDGVSAREVARKLFGSDTGSARRFVDIGINNRKRIRDEESEAMWSHVKRSTGGKQMSLAQSQQAADFIRNHSSVVESPCKKDSLNIRRDESTIRVRKRFLQTSLSRIYDDMKLKHPDWGFIPQSGPNKGIFSPFSERTFRNCKPKEVVRMSNSDRVICACIKHIQMRLLFAR